MERARHYLRNEVLYVIIEVNLYTGYVKYAACMR